MLMGEADLVDGCVRTARHEKDASGIIVYLMEELGDARLRTAELKRYTQEAIDLIEKSKERDHMFEIAGHLIHGIPDTLFKLDKALDAAALAAARLDYEEIKQNLKPEKAEELENVLNDVRLRYLNRRSNNTAPKDGTMNPTQTAEELETLATITETTGAVPLARLANLIAQLEGPRPKTATDVVANAASFFRKMAATLPNEKQPSRVRLAGVLRRIFADGMQMDAGTMLAAIFSQASSREDVIDGFMQANPSMSKEDAEKAADMWEKNKDVVKNKHQ